MEKVIREQIKKLKKEKEYDKIYEIYGREEYLKNTPYLIKMKEINGLKKEGKYFDILNKYGEKAYNQTLKRAMYEEIKENRGILRAGLWRIKEGVKRGIKHTALIGTGVLMIIPPLTSNYAKGEKDKNSVIYAEEIGEYDKKIKSYAKEVMAMNLDDTQVFMKVIDDMWEGIQGYGVPEKDITGFSELDLADEDGYGVCRNMASDVARKLNEISPKYNARTIIVKTSDYGQYRIADINRKFIKNEEEHESNDENAEKSDPTIFDKVIGAVAGNHMVTLVDIPEEDLILVLDPTNPGIGIYRNGEIIMFNSDKQNGVEFEPKEYISATMGVGIGDGLENIFGVIDDYGKSYKKPKLSFDELEEKYGLDAQNKALKYVREKNNFKESLKVKNNEENTKEEDRYDREENIKQTNNETAKEQDDGNVR